MYTFRAGAGQDSKRESLRLGKLARPVRSITGRLVPEKSRRARWEALQKGLDDELRRYRHAAPVFSDGATDDVVTQYLRRTAETFGLGYVPPEFGGMTTCETFAALCQRTVDIARELFGPSWKSYVGHVGMPASAVKTLTHPDNAFQYERKPGERAKKKKDRKAIGVRVSAVADLRIAQFILMVHMNGIREALNDTERSLWVLLQQTHDPRLTGEDARTSRMAYVARGRQHIREALGKMLVDVPKPYWMPLRALAMIEFPNLTSREAMILRHHDMIENGEIAASWLSQGAYDGLRDPDVVTPVEYDFESVVDGPPSKISKRKRRMMGTGVKIPEEPADMRREREKRQGVKSHWYWNFLWDEARRLGLKRPPRARRFWSDETWERFFQERERAHLQRDVEKGEKKHKLKQRERDIDWYVQEMWKVKYRERNQFLRWLNKHAGEEGAAEEALSAYFAQQTAQADEMVNDGLVDTAAIRLGRRKDRELFRAMKADPKVLAASRHRKWLIEQLLARDYDAEKSAAELRAEMRERGLDPTRSVDRDTFKLLLQRERYVELQRAGLLAGRENDWGREAPEGSVARERAEAREARLAARAAESGEGGGGEES